MDDEELTRLAAQELLRDAKKFMAQRNAEFRATQLKTPMKPNKVFLSNTIRNVVSYNKTRKGGAPRQDDIAKANVENKLRDKKEEAKRKH
ncbi:hypothetical protein QE152_g4705 [Popillia japonica]|uniref:Uncharacterized protein n=1 Tax=Popillia japonica TaxID=7064 RepID=A0AAW1MXF3_POPJA